MSSGMIVSNGGRFDPVVGRAVVGAVVTPPIMKMSSPESKVSMSLVVFKVLNMAISNSTNPNA